MRTGRTLRDALIGIDARKSYRPSDWPPAPWVVEAAGRTWAMATDGRIAVLVDRFAHDLGELHLAPPRVALEVRQWMAAQAVASLTTEAGRLLAFAGVVADVCTACENQRRVECDACDGTGDTYCECSRCGPECERCGGVGTMPCPTCSPDLHDERPAALLYSVVNRPLLAYVLDALDLAEDDPVCIAKVLLHPSSPCYVLAPPNSDAWRAFVMVMRPDAFTAAELAIQFDRPESWPTLTRETRTTG